MRHLSIFSAAAIVVALFLLSSTLVAADGHVPEDFKCQRCLELARRVIHQKEDPKKACFSPSSVKNTCDLFFNKFPAVIRNILRFRAVALSSSSLPTISEKFDEKIYDKVCVATTMCPRRDMYQDLHVDGAANWDVKITPVMGSRPAQNAVRLTVIDNVPVEHSPAFLNFFNYSAKFKNCPTTHGTTWMNKTVHTTLVTGLNVGQVTNVDVGGEITLPIKLQEKGAGIRLVAIGDPCFSGQWVSCFWGEKWKILPRLTGLFNTLAAQKDSLHTWSLLGDNFYDAGGNLAEIFFKQLSVQALSIPASYIAGNHDFWEHGKESAHGTDTFGNGMMQLYGVDSVAAMQTGDKQVFNFSISPSAPKGSNQVSNLAAVENFISWTQVGNVAFINSNGAATRASSETYFRQACDWVGRTKSISWVIVQNHWSAINFDCQPGMDAHDIHDFIVTLPGCSEMANHTLWFEGHSHENKIIKKNVGFRFGGFGMSASPLEVNFGIPFIDTYRDEMEIWYFPISNFLDDGDKKWKTLMDCVSSKGGLHQCHHLAELWFKAPAPKNRILK